MRSFTTTDGVELAYTDIGVQAGEGTVIVMVHGWGFSRRFFAPVLADLAATTRVVTLDLRGHGESAVPPCSPRIARLGADLHELLVHLDLRRVTLLGWSLGCAVVWSRLEVFGYDRVERLILCSQVPRQYLAVDWPWHHAQCFDDAATAAFLTRWQVDGAALIDQQVDEIAVRPVPAELRVTWIEEMSRCDAQTRNAVMVDHTRHDWRDFLATVAVPVLVLEGEQDKAYDWRGVAWIADQVPDGRFVAFPDSAHVLFHDEPARFVREITAWVQTPSRGLSPR